MGLSSILGTATSGLQAIQTQLQWRTDNIDNAQDTSYGRRDAVTVSLSTHSVTVSVRRASDAGLLTQSLDANSQATAASTTSDYFTQLGDVLGTTQSTPYLQQAVDDFTAAWKSFETDTSSSTSETQVVSTAQSLAQDMSSEAQQLVTVGQEARTAAGDAVTSLNGKLQDLAAVNKTLSSDPNAGTNDPGLLDKRDSLVTDISSLVGVTTVTHSDGSIALYTKTGSVLVDHDANQFQWNDVSGGQAYISLAGSTGTAPGLNGAFSGGKIGATLEFLDPDTSSTDPNVGTLAKAQAQLDDLAGQLAGQTTGTFGGAYYAATADRTTDLDGGSSPEPTAPSPMVSFFTIDNGSPPTETASQSLAVNSSLIDGTATVKRQSATAVVAALTATSRSMSTAGISADNVTYSGLAAAIAGYHSTSQSAASSDSTRLSATSQTLQTRLTSETGVNMDTELAQLTVLQNAYAANARVITTVSSMFDTLLAIGK